MKTIVIVSVKGGVGKTTVSVGLAKALQRAGHRVGLLDLDYRSPSVPLALGADPEDRKLDLRHGETALGDALIPPEIGGMPVFSMAFIWPAGQAVMVEDDAAAEDVRQVLDGTIAWPDGLEYLVVDTPPTSSGIVMTALKVGGEVGALVVTIPGALSAAAAARTVDLLTETGVPLYGGVINMVADERLREPDRPFMAHWPFTVQLQDTRLSAGVGNNDKGFDTLAHFVLSTTPVVLTVKPPEEATWNRLVAALRRDKAKQASKSSTS